MKTAIIIFFAAAANIVVNAQPRIEISADFVFTSTAPNGVEVFKSYGFVRGDSIEYTNIESGGFKSGRVENRRVDFGDIHDIPSLAGREPIVNSASPHEEMKFDGENLIKKIIVRTTKCTNNVIYLEIEYCDCRENLKSEYKFFIKSSTKFRVLLELMNILDFLDNYNR